MTCTTLTWTALHAACVCGHVDVVRVLVGCAGVDVDFADKTEGMTPLYISAFNGHTKLVKVRCAPTPTNGTNSVRNTVELDLVKIQ